MSKTPKDELEDLEAGNADVTGGGLVKKVGTDGIQKLHSEPAVTHMPKANYDDAGFNGKPTTLDPTARR